MPNTGLIKTANGSMISYEIWCDMLRNLPQPKSKVSEPINTLPIEKYSMIIQKITRQ